MNGALDLAAVGAVAAAAGGIVSAVNLDDVTFCVLHAAGALDEIGAHEAHLVAGEHAEIFLGGLLHEVLPLNVNFLCKRHLTAA